MRSTVLDAAGFPAEEGPVTVSITSPSGRAEHLRLQDLVIRGGGYNTVLIRYGVGVEFLFQQRDEFAKLDRA